MTNQAPPVTFVDNPHAPEVFSTDASGFLRLEGNIHITFEAPRVNHVSNPGPVNRVVIGRLVMPISGAQRLVLGLYDYLKKQGLDPMAAMTPPRDQVQ